MNFGIITLLPAILVILLSVKTKRTTEALLCGFLSSYLIIAAKTEQNPIKLMSKAFFSVLTDYDTMWLIVVCGLFWSLIAVINTSGGTYAIANLLSRICKTPKSVLLVSWLLGLLVSIDDYLNILALSSCTRKLSDRKKVPREALAYVINSMGAPVCALVPFSTWAIFFSGVFYKQESIVNLGYGSAMQTYIHTIPFMFYAIFAVLLVPLFIFGVIPKIGMMSNAYKRVETTGRIYSVSSDKFNEKDFTENKHRNVSSWDFIIPISVLIISQIFLDDMFFAIVTSLLTAAIMYIPRHKVTANRFADLWVGGFADSIPTLVIIFSAFLMRKASEDINLPTYMMNLFQPFINKNIMPMLSFVVVSILGFITGTSWGIPAICVPVLIPLGASVDANLLLIMAAIVCGGTFSSHSCFYSDAVVLTASACGIDNMEHVNSELPYTLTAFALSTLAFLVCGFIF